MTDGTGGIGGTINSNPTPSIANPTSFIFLNGNSGLTGSAAQNNSATNANVGYGGGGVSATNQYGSATGGSGGAGAYIKITYGPGQVVYNSALSYILGANGIGGGNSGSTGGIKITWS